MRWNGRRAVQLKPNLPHDSTVTPTFIETPTGLPSTGPRRLETSMLEVGFKVPSSQLYCSRILSVFSSNAEWMVKHEQDEFCVMVGVLGLRLVN